MQVRASRSSDISLKSIGSGNNFKMRGMPFSRRKGVLSNNIPVKRIDCGNKLVVFDYFNKFSRYRGAEDEISNLSLKKRLSD